MTHIELTDVTGTRWVGDSSDEPLTTEASESLAELLSNFKDLDHLSLEVSGTKTYFNPAHIISVSIHSEG